jgi:hypothetical protein
VKTHNGTPKSTRCDVLPTCPECRRDLLTACVHEAFVLFCRCGRPIRPEDLAKRSSSEDKTALAALLKTCEDQLASVTASADQERTQGHDPKNGGLDRFLQHLEAQVLLLRALIRPAPDRPIARSRGTLKFVSS